MTYISFNYLVFLLSFFVYDQNQENWTAYLTDRNILVVEGKILIEEGKIARLRPISFFDKTVFLKLEIMGGSNREKIDSYVNYLQPNLFVTKFVVIELCNQQKIKLRTEKK